MKKKPFLIFCSIAFLLLLFFMFPEQTVSYTKNGLLLWYQTIVPSLAPFLVLSALLRAYFPFRNKSIALLGLFGGCPAGAAVLTGLIKENRLAVSEGQFFLAFTNNASPVFFLYYISSVILTAPEHALFYWLCPAAASFLAALLLCRPLPAHRKKNGTDSGHLPKPPAKNALPLIARFDQAVTETAEILVKVGGYLILFSIINGFFLSIPGIPGSIRILVSGLMEMTTGLYELQRQNVFGKFQPMAALMIASFGGLSTLAQTQSVIKGSGLSLRPYLQCRLLQTLFTGLFIFIHILI